MITDFLFRRCARARAQGKNQILLQTEREALENTLLQYNYESKEIYRKSIQYRKTMLGALANYYLVVI